MHSLRIEGPDRAGLGARITRAVADETNFRSRSVLFDTFDRGKEYARRPFVEAPRDHELQLRTSVRQGLKNACQHSRSIENVTDPNVDFLDRVPYGKRSRALLNISMGYTMEEWLTKPYLPRILRTTRMDSFRFASVSTAK